METTFAEKPNENKIDKKSTNNWSAKKKKPYCAKYVYICVELAHKSTHTHFISYVKYAQQLRMDGFLTLSAIYF